MKRETKIKIGKVILKTLATAGVLSMAILAPNVLQVLGSFYKGEKKKYNVKYYVKNKITDLKKQGFITFEEENNRIFVRLTDKGRERLLKYQLREIVIKKPKKWDKKWRVIIFDIKERKRKVRDGLRVELINLGFLRLQNSVWVYPYECEEAIIILKAYFHLGKDVLYMTVEKIEDDKWLKKKFSLT